MIDINNFFWHECTVVGFIQTFRNFRFETAIAGGQGYVKRNAMNPEYLQLVAPTVRGSYFAWYVKDTTTALVIGKRITPEEPNRMWRGIHNIKEQNNSLAVKEAYVPR